MFSTKENKLKKLFLSSILAITIFGTSAFGAIATISGPLAIYVYLTGGVAVVSGVTGLATGDPDGIEMTLYGLLFLEEKNDRATFPELTVDLVEKLELTNEEQTSYSKDLKALRLTLDHLATSTKEMQDKDAQEVIGEIDKVFTGNFSEATMSTVDKIRSYNNEIVNANK